MITIYKTLEFELQSQLHLNNPIGKAIKVTRFEIVCDACLMN